MTPSLQSCLKYLEDKRKELQISIVTDEEINGYCYEVKLGDLSMLVSPDLFDKLYGGGYYENT